MLISVERPSVIEDALLPFSRLSQSESLSRSILPVWSDTVCNRTIIVSLPVCMYVCVFVCARVHVCVRACVCACVCV